MIKKKDMEKIILKTGNYNLKDCIKIIIGKEEKNTMKMEHLDVNIEIKMIIKKKKRKMIKVD